MVAGQCGETGVNVVGLVNYTTNIDEMRALEIEIRPANV